MLLLERVSDELYTRLARLLADIGARAVHNAREREHKARRDRILGCSARASDELRDDRVDARLGAHEHAECAGGTRAHSETRGIARALDKRALELREEGLDEHRDALEHRCERAEDRGLDRGRVRRRLRRDTDERPGEGHDERLDRGLFCALDEIADGVGGLLALLIAARRKTGDDDRDGGGDALWQAEAGHVDARSSGTLNGAAQGYDQRFQLILGDRLDENIECAPSSSMDRYFPVVKEGDELPYPVDAIQGVVKFGNLAEDGEQLATTGPAFDAVVLGPEKKLVSLGTL